MKTKLLCFMGLIICSTSFAYAQLSGAATSSYVCFSCHKDQQKDWSTTWHSRSHIDSNPIYKAIVNYMSRVTYQPEESILVGCAQCHNPKMTIKEISGKDSFTLAKVLNVETEQTKRIEASVGNISLKDGISCNICHNVEKVNESMDMEMRGFKAVEWGPRDVVFGPFEDDGRAGIHKSIQKDHFLNPDKLCMVCHFGGETDTKVELYATGKEFIGSDDTSQKCADCHMSTKRKGVITPEITKAGITAKERNIRSHLFEGARNSDIMKETLSLNAKPDGNNIILEVTNLTPHKAPTGFGGRSMDIKIEFKNGANVVDTQTYTLEIVYVDKKGRETIPYLASSIKSDNRLSPHESRKLSIPKFPNATSAKVTVTYRLVSDRILKLINFSDPIFNKNYPVASLDVNF
ncbi:MAG: cytochrome c family protein [Campylobacteraceae bacterium]|nr:cytochrome c family protein [Campylobacteraceae bacterium]